MIRSESGVRVDRSRISHLNLFFASYEFVTNRHSVVRVKYIYTENTRRSCIITLLTHILNFSIGLAKSPYNI